MRSVAFALALCAAATGCPYFSPSDPEPNQVAQAKFQFDSFHVIAHRCGAGLAPENTLPAFRRSLALGFYEVELDLHLSRDEVLILFHDADLEHKTDRHGSVSSYTALELRAPRFLSGDFSPGGTIDITYKDQELQTSFAKALQVPIFLANVTALTGQGQGRLQNRFQAHGAEAIESRNECIAGSGNASREQPVGRYEVEILFGKPGERGALRCSRIAIDGGDLSRLRAVDQHRRFAAQGVHVRIQHALGEDGGDCRINRITPPVQNLHPTKR